MLHFSINYGQVREDLIPCVVFEVGFTQPYEELRDDAEKWLLHSSGLVGLVVLVNIDEDVKTLGNQKKTRAFTSRSRGLILNYGNGLAKAKAGIEASGLENSDDDKTEPTLVYHVHITNNKIHTPSAIPPQHNK